MIVEIKMIIGGKDFVKRYSDCGLNLKCEQTGDIYAEAIDLADAPFTYIETEETDETEDEEYD